MSKRKDKYNGFKVPKRNGPSSTKCVGFIYQMIKEANDTLLNEDVKKAFNNFVDCLLQYDIYSWIDKQYTSGIAIKEYDNTYLVYDNMKAINCRFKYDNASYNSETKKKLTEECSIVLQQYIPLYDLIKHDVVPYMKKKQWEISSKRDIENYHRLIDREEKIIVHYENMIRQSRSRMCEYAEKALALTS